MCVCVNICATVYVCTVHVLSEQLYGNGSAPEPLHRLWDLNAGHQAHEQARVPY